MWLQTLGRLADSLRSQAHGSPTREFHSHAYQRYNARRLEHLASLRIPVRGMSVLEVGAGIGDISHYYLDRDCAVTITEARPVNLAYLRKRYPRSDVQALDLDRPQLAVDREFDLVHCYGVLYHLREPERALDFLAQHCRRYMFLETCVSYGDDEALHRVSETRWHPSQAVSGVGCRPTRPWLFKELKRRFQYVYIPRTQPNHEEFPIAWTAGPTSTGGYVRSIFLCARQPIENEMLVEELLTSQTRHA